MKAFRERIKNIKYNDYEQGWSEMQNRIPIYPKRNINGKILVSCIVILLFTTSIYLNKQNNNSELHEKPMKILHKYDGIEAAQDKLKEKEYSLLSKNKNHKSLDNEIITKEKKIKLNTQSKSEAKLTENLNSISRLIHIDRVLSQPKIIINESNNKNNEASSGNFQLSLNEEKSSDLLETLSLENQMNLLTNIKSEREILLISKIKTLNLCLQNNKLTPAIENKFINNHHSQKSYIGFTFGYTYFNISPGINIGVNYEYRLDRFITPFILLAYSNGRGDENGNPMPEFFTKESMATAGIGLSLNPLNTQKHLFRLKGGFTINDYSAQKRYENGSEVSLQYKSNFGYGYIMGAEYLYRFPGLDLGLNVGTYIHDDAASYFNLSIYKHF